MSKDRRAKQVQEALGIGYAHAFRLVRTRQSLIDSDGRLSQRGTLVDDCRILLNAEREARK